MVTDPAAAADQVDRSGRDWVREDVSCALRLSGVTAQRRLDVAQTLVHLLPATLTLLRRGEISHLHAMALAEAVDELNDEARAEVETRAPRRAGEQSLAEFRRTVRRAVASVAAAFVDKQRTEAMAERRVCVSPRDDGMAELWALLPAEGAAAVVAAIDALAGPTSAADPRGADQRRADVLVEIAVAALHDPLLPKAQGLRPAIQITVAMSTLLGCDDQPGELAGHGPIPAAVARCIASDETGTWRRLVTDPLTGQRPTTAHHLPAAARSRRVRRGPRPDLRVPALQSAGASMPLGSPSPVPRRWRDEPRESRRAVRTAPHLQAPDGLAGSPRARRHHHLDKSREAPLPITTARLALRHQPQW